MPTAFQSRVYEVVRRIPRGRVATYGEVASAIGCGSCRAIGQALKRNPDAPRIPCHRVIASNLGIGGFQGQSQGAAITEKRRRLKAEGVRFQNGKLEDPARCLALQNANSNRKKESTS